MRETRNHVSVTFFGISEKLNYTFKCFIDIPKKFIRTEFRVSFISFQVIVIRITTLINNFVALG